MIAFLDFEASSLARNSYPIEIAWIFENGESQCHLIRPLPEWTDWSEEAEEIHGIPRALLMAQGVPVDVVVTRMLDALAGHDLYASSPSWDGKWLSLLLRAAGHPRHALRLKKSDEAFQDAARRSLSRSHSGSEIPEEEVGRLVTSMIEATRPPVPAHRALPDAELERTRWLKAGSLSLEVKEAAGPVSR